MTSVQMLRWDNNQLEHDITLVNSTDKQNQTNQSVSCILPFLQIKSDTTEFHKVLQLKTD